MRKTRSTRSRSGRLKPRLAAIKRPNSRQKALADAILSGPRGKRAIGGPFEIWLNAPEFGDLAQRLGAHCRYHTALPPRLSEFAILATAQHWRAQYEWFAHASHAEHAGVKAKTIAAIRAGRIPAKAPADERAIYIFIRELYRTRRVSDRTYAKLRSILGDPAMVEFVGILGYYALISMTLNVFNAPIPADATPAFRES